MNSFPGVTRAVTYFALEDIKADHARHRANVGMPHLGDELADGRVEGVFVRDDNVDNELATLVGSVLRAHKPPLKVSALGVEGHSTDLGVSRKRTKLLELPSNPEGHARKKGGGEEGDTKVQKRVSESRKMFLRALHLGRCQLVIKELQYYIKHAIIANPVVLKI